MNENMQSQLLEDNSEFKKEEKSDNVKHEISAMKTFMVLQSLTLVSLCIGIVFLSYNDKPGWGWLIVLSLFVANMNYTYTKD